MYLFTVSLFGRGLYQLILTTQYTTNRTGNSTPSGLCRGKDLGGWGVTELIMHVQSIFWSDYIMPPKSKWSSLVTIIFGYYLSTQSVSQFTHTVIMTYTHSDYYNVHQTVLSHSVPTHYSL